MKVSPPTRNLTKIVPLVLTPPLLLLTSIISPAGVTAASPSNTYAYAICPSVCARDRGAVRLFLSSIKIMY